MITPWQLAGVTVLKSTPSLPAATTITLFSPVTWSIADCQAALQLPGPPRLMLSTLAGVGFDGAPGTEMPAAQRMPSMMSES